MTRFPITKHGRDHRQPGTDDADDPGGHDPIPPGPLSNKLPIITADVEITSLADSTPLTIDLSTGVTRTSDGGLTWIGSPSDPFTGTYYSYNWGTNVNRINIIHPGVYIIRYFWQILSFSGSWAGGNQQWFGMKTNVVGDWGMANDGDNADSVEAHNIGLPEGFDTSWKVKDEKVLINTSGTSIVDYTVQFVGQPSLSVSDSYAGISIVRLGDIT